MIKRYDAYVSSSKIKGPRFVDEIESEFGTLCQASDVLELIAQKDGELAEVKDQLKDATDMLRIAGFGEAADTILAKYQKRVDINDEEYIITSVEVKDPNFRPLTEDEIENGVKITFDFSEYQKE